MPRNTLTFNLPEEKEAFNACLLGSRYLNVLRDFDHDLRSKAKHGAGREAKRAQWARDRLFVYLNEHGVDLYE